MLNPASLDDLAVRWHPNPLDDADAALMARTRLDAAWRALQEELPTLVGRIDAGSVAAESVVDVVCDAALRVLQNPEGLTQFTVSIDDFSKSGQRDPRSVSNDLYFTAAELRRLSPATRVGSFTIRPGGV